MKPNSTQKFKQAIRTANMPEAQRNVLLKVIENGGIQDPVLDDVFWFNAHCARVTASGEIVDL